MTTVYKICAASEWHEAERDGTYSGNADDLRDGFIHLSRAEQVAGTLERHFADKPDLFLVAIDGDLLGAALRWESSRGGELFPHLYGVLSLKAVVHVKALALSPDGSHLCPELST